MFDCMLNQRYLTCGMRTTNNDDQNKTQSWSCARLAIFTKYKKKNLYL
jgi:hypothetical protein